MAGALLGERSGSGWHLHWIRYRPKHWPPDHSLGFRHGAHGRAPSRLQWQSPYSKLLVRAPFLALAGVASLGAATFLAAVYPASSEESTAMAMSGMSGMSGSSISGSSGKKCGHRLMHDGQQRCPEDRSRCDRHAQHAHEWKFGTKYERV